MATETATTESSAGDRAPFRWKAFASYVASFALAAIVLGIGAAVILGHEPLERRASTMAQSRTVRLLVDWPALARPKDAPAPKTLDEATWMPKQFREQVMARAMDAMSKCPDPLGPEAIAAVGQSMVDSGWFATVPNVSREGADVIRVTGTWRTPAAVVRVGDKEIAVGWDAKPLPVVYDKPGLSGMYQIGDVREGPVYRADGQPDCSKPWPGSDLPAALELLDLVARQPFASQIAGVSVGRHQDEQSLEIVTHAGTRVVWGGRPTKPLIGEASTAQKLEKLAWLDKKFKRIDAGRSPQTPIEVWWPLSRPLEIDRSASASAGKP